MRRPLTAYPNQPGHRFSDPYKTNFHKKQRFVIKQNTETCKINIYNIILK